MRRNDDYLNTFYKNLSLWLVIGIVVIFLFNIFNKPKTNIPEITYTDFINYIKQGEVAKVTIEDENVMGQFVNDVAFRSAIPIGDQDIFSLLKEHNVTVKIKPRQETPWYMTLLISWFPMLLLIAVWIFFMRQMQGPGGRAMSFGRSRARMLSGENINITFKDVAGVDEAKEELAEIIEFLKDPEKFTRLGGRPPKGILLVGPPGTGKTLLAKAISGEAGCPFFSISGSDFVEMFVGIGASRVRDLFIQAKRSAPCIIFIDEIDAVGRHRGAGLGGGHDEREQTLNQLLVEMDGFETEEGVIVIAATNRPDVLDPALLRPGRFDRQVTVPVPDLHGRQKILSVHVKKIELDEEVDLSIIAKGTPGFSGADLENLVNEAALLAAKAGKEKVEMEDFDTAKDKVLMGAERKSMILSEEEKRVTAYHEAGHALVANLLPGSDPIHKVSIIPRGQALGITQQLPEDDRHTYYRGYLMNQLSILLGGRIAEELVLDDFTTGAGNDIERVTDLARKMVCNWGMSEEFGPVAFGKHEEHIFLGKEFGQVKDFSEETAKKIDEEVKKLVMTAYKRSKKLVEQHIDCLHSIANALLEKETITGTDIDRIMEQCA